MWDHESKREFFITDRFEGANVVIQSLENGEIFIIERNMFKEMPKEGDIVYLEGAKFIFDEFQTSERKKSLSVRVNKLWKRKKKDKE